MFEQSILPDYAGGRKTGAFAASLSAQILAAGVLVVVPLFYNDVLPMLRMNTPLSVTLTTYQPAPPVLEQAPASDAMRAPTRVPTRPFVEPARDSAPLTQRTTSIDFDAPATPLFTSLTTLAAGVPGTQAPQVIDIAPPPPPPPAPVPKQPHEPVRVTSELQAAKILHKVVPAYPPLAKQARIQGTVHLMGVIAKDGTIQQLKIVSGHPLLVQAAFDAVRQWTYKPTILNNEPVEVIAPIDVIFTLSN
jgi:periplasmic protein TonB